MTIRYYNRLNSSGGGGFHAQILGSGAGGSFSSGSSSGGSVAKTFSIETEGPEIACP